MDGYDLGRLLRSERNRAEDRLDELDRRLNKLRAAEASRRTELSETIKKYAAVRLDLIGQDAAKQLSNACVQSARALAERKHQADQAHAEIASLSQAMVSVQDRLDAAHDACREAQEVLNRRLSTVDRQLTSNLDFQSLASAATRHLRFAQSAKEKADQALAELAEKRKAYDDDKVFNYLWKKGVCTSEYSSTGLIRRLDEWAASVTGYIAAKKQLDLLIKLPEFLQKRAEELQAAVEAADEDVLVYRCRIEADHGIPSLSQLAERCQADANRVLAELSEMEEKKAARLQFLIDIADNEDAAYKEALESYSGSLAGLSAADLLAQAKETETNKDDRLAHEVERLENAIKQNRVDQGELRRLIDDALQAKQRAANAYSDFRRRGYESSDYRFRGFDSGMVAGFIAGAVASHAFESAISASAIKSVSSSYTGFGGDSPGSSFSTGGDFGGGGFSTGGDF